MKKLKKVGWGFGLCNMRCEHCYNASSDCALIPRYSFQELKGVADKICPATRDINFGTGEMICNPNVLELVYYIAGTYGHIDMSVTSNGYTVVEMNPVEVKRLFNDVDISIDFPDKEKHNDFRNHPMAWDWAIRALSILKELRLLHTVVTCVTSKTTNEDILGLLRLAKEYDALFRINWFRHVGRGKSDLKVSAKRAWEIVEFLSSKGIFVSLDPVFSGPLGYHSHPCPAGRSSARIHQDMSVTAYPFLKGDDWTAGNILNGDTTLETVYQSKAFKRLRARKVSGCSSCEFLITCAGGCVTRATLHNGGMEFRDDFCPIEAGELLTVERIREKGLTFQKIGNLVHDGYLCTTIIKPY